MHVDLRGMAPLLQVRDMPAALAFYRDALGFAIVSAAGAAPHFGWVLLARDGIELMLGAASGDPPPPGDAEPGRIAAHRDVTLFFGCPDLDGAHARLRGLGLEVEPPGPTSYGFRALSLTDPDGYGLCLHWPSSAESVADWRARYGFDPDAAVPRRG